MDDFLFSVVGGWVDPWRPDASHQNDIVGRAAVGAAMQFLAGGYTVVLEGTVFPDVLEGLAAACREREVTFHYVVLRAPLSICVDRATARDGRSPSVSHFEDLHAQFRRSDTRAPTSSTRAARPTRSRRQSSRRSVRARSLRSPDVSLTRVRRCVGHARGLRCRSE